MKAGFLGGKPAPRISTTSSSHKADDAGAPASAAQQPATTPPTPPPNGQPGTSATTPHQQPNAASWQQCMELLKSGSDEKKFVGLLLVTKLLPQGTDSALQSVLDAVGWPFLQRMLLPLRQQQQQQQQVPEDKRQQQQLSVSLGLSIISASARLQEVAAGEELLQLTPLLAKVAAAGGVAPAFTYQQQHEQQRQGPAADKPWEDTASDLAAAVDALECLVACASSGSYQRSVLLESRGLSTATAALATALAATQRCQDAAAAANGSRATAEAAAAAAAAAAAQAAAHAVMLSMQLLGVLLTDATAAADRAAATGSSSSRAQTLQQHPVEAAAAVMLLAAVFGSQQHPSATAAAAAAQHSSASQQQAPSVDAAALQLEALHTLLMLLPLPEGATPAQSVLTSAAAALAAQADTPAAAQAAVQASAASAGRSSTEQEAATGLSVTDQQLLHQAVAAAGDWPASLRQGLVQVLRGRVGAVQRHSALQLAAAAVELLGPAWLLPPQQHGQQQLDSSSSSSSGRPEECLLVLMEVLAIETPLLLSDAVNPGAAVPKSDAAMAAAAARAAAGEAAGEEGVPSDAGVDSDADADADMAEGVDGQPDTPQLLAVRQAVEQQLKQHEQQQQGGDQQQPSSSGWPGPPGFQEQQQGETGKQQQQQQQQLRPLRQQLAELQLPDDKPVGDGEQEAGARALQLLPSCYSLLEACLEVLVAQVSLSEELADLHSAPDTLTPDTQRTAAAAAGEGEGSSYAGGVLGGRPVSWQEVLPVLGLAQVEQLMGRMGQVTQVLCEFLEYATSPAAAAGEAAAPVNPWLVVGAVRVLGRFLADAPDAHEDAVRQLLPRLLLQQQDSGVTEAAAAAANGTSHPPQQQQGGVGAGGVLPVPVISFLLPAMLTWTSRHHSSCQQWAALLLDPSNGCLTALAAHVAEVAAAAAAAGPGDPASSREERVSQAEVQLGSACQVLYQLLSSQAVLLSRQQTKKQHQQPAAALPALQKSQTDALAVALQALCGWSAACRQQLAAQQTAGQQVVESGGLPPSVAAAAALLAAQGVPLPTLLPAAALTGQLLGLVQVPAGAAAELLCWGCQAGWCLQLTAAAQTSAVVSPIVQLMLQVWDVAELEEVWDACLSSAAELLSQHAASGVVARALSGAAWLKDAMQGWQQEGSRAVSDATVDEAAAAVVDGSMGLQLLLQAAAAVLGLR